MSLIHLNTQKTPTDLSIADLIEKAKQAYKIGKLKVRDKCCNKCAFSPNSLERVDGYGWESAAEKWSEGSIFVCHEGLPGHQQHVQGESLQVCAGWKAMEGKPLSEWLKLAYTDGREPDKKFNAGYLYMPEDDDLDNVIKQWCEPCINYDTCDIYAAAIATSSGIRGHEPQQWIHGDDGNPHCTERTTYEI